MKIVFITTRTDKASFKFRVSQFLQYIDKVGISYDIEILKKGFLNRRGLFNKLISYDIVFIQKRLLGWIDLRALKRKSKRIVYDFDDSIMFNHRDGRTWQSFRIRMRFRSMMRAADQIVAGNTFLANHAKNYTEEEKIKIIPTVVDDAIWDRKYRKEIIREKIVIGWVGSQSTLPYWFEKCDIWKKVCETYPQVQFRVICDKSKDVFIAHKYKDYNFEAIEWNEKDQVSLCSDFDIGIMPLPDNQWTRGKCGFKLIQYLSLGIASIASPVGVNCDIVIHNHTGLLANTNQEWEYCLKRLIENPKLRLSIGERGYFHVQANFVLGVWLDNFLELFKYRLKTPCGSRRNQV